MSFCTLNEATLRDIFRQNEDLRDEEEHIEGKRSNRIGLIWIVLETRVNSKLSFWSINTINLGPLLRIIFRNVKLATCPTLSTCES
jgi:hypothetical protein